MERLCSFFLGYGINKIVGIFLQARAYDLV